MLGRVIVGSASGLEDGTRRRLDSGHGWTLPGSGAFRTTCNLPRTTHALARPPDGHYRARWYAHPPAVARPAPLALPPALRARARDARAHTSASGDALGSAGGKLAADGARAAGGERGDGAAAARD